MTDAAPAKKAKTFKRTCPECGVAFATSTHDRMFCSDAHKATFHNRSSKVGRSLVPLAMAWRAGRNHKGNSAEAKAMRASAARAFADMCALLDIEVTADRVEQRMPKLQYVRARWRKEGILRREETAAYHEAEAAKAASKTPAKPAAK
jgi:ribosomal protein S27AE